MLPRLFAAGHFGLVPDEAYYATWSLYPGFGYYDHPPMVAWTIWLGRAIFGESEWAVRSLFLAANLLTCAALYRIGERLTGDPRIGATAAIAYAVIPGALLAFAVATPDGPSTLFWVLTLLAVAEFIRDRNANWWLVAGAFAGLGLLSKYTVAFLGVGHLFYLLTSRERLSWLKLWQVWAGAALAVLLFSPVIWIAARHGFDTFRFQLGRTTLEHPQTIGTGEFIRFLIETAIQLLPTLFVFMLIGVIAFFARGAKPLALLVLSSAPMAAYFLLHAVFGRVNPNWISPLYPVLALVGAWAAVSIRPRRAWLRWPLDVVYVLHVPLGLSLTLVAIITVADRTLPLVGPMPILTYALGYIYGWPDLEQKIETTAKANGAEWIDIGDYALNGMITYYGKMARSPLPVYDTDQAFRYRFMPPLTDAIRAEPHLIVRAAAGGSAPDGSTSLGTITRDYQGETLASYDVFLIK